jgi:hypothetical protein
VCFVDLHSGSLSHKKREKN